MAEEIITQIPGYEKGEVHRVKAEDEIGASFLIAKMASDFEKPDKVHTLWDYEVQEKMWPLGVRDLLWVGKKTEERLTAYGIHTIGDLAKLGMGSLTRLVGQKFAQQLHENANGRDDFRTSTVSMFIKHSDFSVQQKQTSLSQPTDVTAIILNEARRMLGEIWDGQTPIRQVGLGISELTHESAVQMSLFEDPKLEYYREWDR